MKLMALTSLIAMCVAEGLIGYSQNAVGSVIAPDECDSTVNDQACDLQTSRDIKMGLKAIHRHVDSNLIGVPQT